MQPSPSIHRIYIDLLMILYELNMAIRILFLSLYDEFFIITFRLKKCSSKNLK